MSEVEVRFARPGEWGEANELHNRAYGQRRSMEEWLWEFRGPLSGEPLMVVASNKSEIVGTQAAIPMYMVDCGSRILTAKSEETLITPEFRGLGIFDRMYEVLLAACRSRGISVIWGFTPATKAFEAIGFETPWRTGQLFLPLTSAAVREAGGMQNAGTTGRLIDLAGAGAATVSKARWRLYSVLMREDRSPADTRVAFTHPDNFPEDCESFSFRFSRRWNLASLHRDPGFMDWRVNMNPHVRARLVVARMGQQTVGWALYSVDSSSNGFIVDLAVAAPEGSESAGFEGRIMDGLLLRSLAALRSAGAKSIRMWSNSDSPYERLIRRRAVRMGFIHLRRGESSVFLPLSNSDELQRVVRGYHSRLSTVGVSG